MINFKKLITLAALGVLSIGAGVSATYLSSNNDVAGVEAAITTANGISTYTHVFSSGELGSASGNQIDFSGIKWNYVNKATNKTWDKDRGQQINGGVLTLTSDGTFFNNKTITGIWVETATNGSGTVSVSDGTQSITKEHSVTKSLSLDELQITQKSGHDMVGNLEIVVKPSSKSVYLHSIKLTYKDTKKVEPAVKGISWANTLPTTIEVGDTVDVSCNVDVVGGADASYLVSIENGSQYAKLDDVNNILTATNAGDVKILSVPIFEGATASCEHTFKVVSPQPVLTLDKTNITGNVSDKTLTLTASGKNLGDNPEYLWASSNPNVISLDPNNKTNVATLTIKGEGSSNVTVSSSNISASCLVTINKDYVKGTIGWALKNATKGDIVTVKGVLTATFGGNHHIQDEYGEAIVVRDFNHNINKIGYEYTVEGKFGDYKGMPQIEKLSSVTVGTVYKNVTPTMISSLSQLNASKAKLITAEVTLNEKVTSLDSTKGQNVNVTIGNDKTVLRIYKDDITFPDFNTIATFFTKTSSTEKYMITGVVGYHDAPQICPRKLNDFSSSRLDDLLEALRLADNKDKVETSNTSDTGNCLTYWNDVKKVVLNEGDKYLLNNSDGFADANARYNAWAARQPIATKPSSGLTIIENSSILIVICISIISITGISILGISLKKKKTR